MDKIKILAIAPYWGMASVMKQVGQNRNDIELTVKLGNYKTCLEVLREEPDYRYDAIVSRGGTAELLRTAASIPVVEIDVSVYDVLRCLKSAQHYLEKFAVVGFSGITECAVQLSAMMQYDFTVCTITAESDIKGELQRLRDQGVELILCDRVSMVNAEELGMNAMFLSSDEASIAAAFDEAVHVCAKYGHFQKQNAALQKLLGVLAPGTSLFTPGGRLIFSNLEQQPGWVGLVEQIQMMLPCLTVGNEPVQRELEWKGELLFLSAFGLEHCGQRCLCIQVRQAQTMPVETGKGVTITHRNEPLFNDVSRVGGAVLVGEIGRRIPAYYQSIWPVLILGETGTGKDTVASILYRNGPFHERMMVTVDCQVLTPRRWKALLSRDSSPFFRTGITIYLRSVDRLENETAEELFRFMEQSNLCQRNRLLFSGVLDRPDIEDEYVLTYLKNHFSTVVLRLPALRQRRQDIPGITALYINQLNMELGKGIIGFASEAMALLQQFGFDGNLAQLSRMMRTLMLTTPGPYIQAEEVRKLIREELPQRSQLLPRGFAAVNLNQSLEAINYDIVRLVLEEEAGNRCRAAKRLDVCRSTVWNMLKRNKES